MSFLYLIPLAVTMAPVVILGLKCISVAVETSIREEIGR